MRLSNEEIKQLMDKNLFFKTKDGKIFGVPKNFLTKNQVLKLKEFAKKLKEKKK